MPEHDRIPLAASDGLAGALQRSRLLRLGLAAALLVTLLGALALALRRPDVPALLPPGTDGVVVLDVSGSIGPSDYRQLTQALDEASAEDRRYGLVAFSDVAYEVFPPGTDRAQLRAMRRFFVPSKTAKRRSIGTSRVGSQVYLASPWSAAFSGGTVISKGLRLAREVIRRDGLPNPAVLLISDLDFDARDAANIDRALAQYAREKIALQIVALGDTQETDYFLAAFERAGGTETSDPVASFRGSRSEARATAREPLLLGGVCLLLLLLLGANELACGRLTWSPETSR